MDDMYSELLMSRLVACDCCDLGEKARMTKHSILVAALELFMSFGFIKTPVRSICDKAGVAKGTFYLYYETKVSVLFDLMKLLTLELDGLIMELDSTKPSLDQMDNIIDKSVNLIEKEKRILKFMHSHEILTFVGIEAPNRLFMSLSKPVSLWLESAIQEGIVTKNVTMFTLEIIFNIIHDVLEKSLLYNYPGDLKAVSSELKKIIRNMLT
jgi:AcrR family transcriptional regulator